jgi:hypothetical protein
VLHALDAGHLRSVLTTYQHHFIDIPTGALLGVLCVWAWPLERRVSMPRRPGNWRPTPAGARWRCAMPLVRAAGGAGSWRSAAPACGCSGRRCPALLVSLNYLGFGARGFQMDADGRMAWPARCCWRPTAWPRRSTAGCGPALPPLREVLPGVAIGTPGALQTCRPSSPRW